MIKKLPTKENAERVKKYLEKTKINKTLLVADLPLLTVACQHDLHVFTHNGVLKKQIDDLLNKVGWKIEGDKSTHTHRLRERERKT